MLDAFGDASLIRHALTFEAALARALAAEGVIDKPAADAIASACAALKPDPEALARDAAHAGTLAIPLVALLRKQISDPKIAEAAHKGATSQDVADTALVLQMKDGAALIERDVSRVPRCRSGPHPKACKDANDRPHTFAAGLADDVRLEVRKLVAGVA